MNRPARFTISLALPFIAAAIGSFSTISAIPTWYASLVKPSFSPPNYLFGPVWTLLYLLMGIALYRVWSKGTENPPVKSAVTLFIIHLIFNLLWSILFFGLHNPALALFDIIILFIFIIVLIKKFYAPDRLAAYLLIPYLLWVAFATALNFEIWRLNS